MKKMFFMSGLQRSGSTLIGSLISQNPDFYVSPTSPLMDYLCHSERLINSLTENYTFDGREVNKSMSKLAFEGFYSHVDKKFIVDKHRGWTRNARTIEKISGTNPKIIATYRPISENVCSFIKLAEKDKNNKLDEDLRNNNLEINNRNRALYIWKNWTSEIYDSLKYGLDNNKDNIHVMHYNDIVNQPQKELDKMYDFLQVERYDRHYFENIQNSLSEQKDEVWGFKGLHDIRSDKINNESIPPSELLDKDIIMEFEKLDNALNKHNTNR